MPSRGELRARAAFSDPEESKACQAILDMMPQATAAEEKAISDGMWLGEFDHLIRGTPAFAEIEQMIEKLPWELDEEASDHQPAQPLDPRIWVPDETPEDPPQQAAQPAEGFTIPAPANDAEADVLCRAYQKADAAKRRAMRAQFELAIKQQRRA